MNDVVGVVAKAERSGHHHWLRSSTARWLHGEGSHRYQFVVGGAAGLAARGTRARRKLAGCCRCSAGQVMLVVWSCGIHGCNYLTVICGGSIC